jgi:hypothetical protein
MSRNNQGASDLHLRWWVGSVVLSGGVLLLLSSQGEASLFEPVRDRQLVCEASDIVHGQVTHVRSGWDDQRTAIWTTATIEIQDVSRGSLSRGASITVKQVGGTVGGYTIVAEGFPIFEQGQEVLLLLRPWEEDAGRYQVWGYDRGMFVVTRRDGRGPTAQRHDVVRSGRPTLHVDRIPPEIVLDDLKRQLNSLIRTCDQ